MERTLRLALAGSSLIIAVGCHFGFGVERVPGPEGQVIPEHEAVYLAKCSGGLRTRSDCERLAEERCGEPGYKTITQPVPEAPGIDPSAEPNRRLYFKCNPAPDDIPDASDEAVDDEDYAGDAVEDPS